MIKIETGESDNWVCFIADDNRSDHVHLANCGHMFDTSTGRGEHGLLCPYKCELKK